jgi:hypothetical protein
MNGRSADERSLLHRVFRAEPGAVPFWLCSSDACLGLDLPHGVVMCAIGAAVIYFWEQPLLALVAVGLITAVATTFLLPFDVCERKARARRRQEMAELEKTKG